MLDREKVIKEFELFIKEYHPACTSEGVELDMFREVLALLKGQDAKERKWLQAIADNQIANAPKDSPMSLDEQLESEYKSGIYDGLQMAFEILTEGR